MVPLRRRLFLLTAAALLPLAAIAGFGLYALVDHQRDEARRAGIELTRALATAVEAEIGRSISVMEAIATSPTLDSGDLPEFFRRVTRVAETQPHWRAIVLVDPNGTPLLHTGFSVGAAIPPLAERANVTTVRETMRPVIGDLARVGAGEAEGGAFDFSVRVPVMRDGVLRFVAIALVDPTAILEILQRQRVPSDWVISIFDAAGQRVARSRAHEENLGKHGAASVVALMAQPAEEGWGPTTAVEGDRIYTAYSRVKNLHWTVATGIPVGLVNGAMLRAALLFGGGILVSLVIGIMAASRIARSITGPIGALGDAAAALGRGEPIDHPVTEIAEIAQVGQALAGAAEERARGERERDALLGREQQARAAAESANRAKDEFLAMLGHELRNPLGAVANAVAVLDHADVAPEAAARARRIISRQTAHLSRLTDDLLDAGRVITGKIVLDRQRIDLAEIVARALTTADVGRHRVVCELQPVWIDGDPIRIEQILMNLVGNAVKYTAAGGTITIAVGRDGDAACLRVSDNGVGMASELATRVFELFVQGDRPLDRASGGLGIGLTLVQRLAELHGGSAAVFSAGPGQGSELTVRIPALPAPHVAAAPVAVPAEAAAGRNVLVVEDNEDARTALCELLALGGHHVRAAADGVSGLATALASRPEIALVDVGLPGMDGYEVARRIRAAEVGGSHMKLVALTGYGLPEDRARALAAGFDVHLVKPVSMVVLGKLLAG
ncbi:MAG: ATP-binding protein [Candidatus Binatia bacterium]